MSDSRTQAIDVIADAMLSGATFPYQIVDALTAAGFEVLAPGELQQVKGHTYCATCKGWSGSHADRGHVMAPVYIRTQPNERGEDA